MIPDVLDSELSRLPDDLLRLTEEFSGQLADAALATAARDIRDVIVVGSGDSLHAGLAAQLAFHSLGRVTCRVMSVHAFPTYAAEWLLPTAAARQLVVVVSASGATPGALGAAEQARKCGATVLSIVGDGSAPLAGHSDLVLAYDLPDPMRSPGVRTYQSSLVALLLLATRLGVLGGRAWLVSANAARREVEGLAADLRRTDPLLRATLANARDIVDHPMIFLGAGPNHGTAKHAAAKVVEASGALAVGQELEEWWHVERMADPADMTTFVIITPRSAPRAGQIVAAAMERGRRVVVVAPQGTATGVVGAVALLVPADVREEFSPLAYQSFGVHVAADMARRLGRRAFSGGDAAVGAMLTQRPFP